MLQQRGGATFNEIMEQPAAWEDVFQQFEAVKNDLLSWFRDGAFKKVVFLGCGASHYAGIAAAHTFRRMTGIFACAFPSSEIICSPEMIQDGDGKTLYVAVSRSGETSETVWAAEKIKEINPSAPLLLITCRPESTLASMADRKLVLEKAHEQGIVMTKSFTSLLLACYLLAGWIGEKSEFVMELERLPSLFDLKKFQKSLQESGAYKDLNQFMYLGAGANFGLACAGALQMKEMANGFGTAVHSLEYRHGHISSITPQLLTVLLVSDRLKKPEEELLGEIAGEKSYTMAICDEAGEGRIRYAAQTLLEMRSGLSEPARGILAVTITQLLAFYRALSKGVNPDRPKHLNPVVKLKEKI
jgi:glucosamine--fructose-6-phosphate aminotransferase (isomerizing)